MYLLWPLLSGQGDSVVDPACLPGPDMMALPLTLHNVDNVIRGFRMLWHLPHCLPTPPSLLIFPQAPFAFQSFSFCQVSLPPPPRDRSNRKRSDSGFELDLFNRHSGPVWDFRLGLHTSRANKTALRLLTSTPNSTGIGPWNAS